MIEPLCEKAFSHANNPDTRPHAGVEDVYKNYRTNYPCVSNMMPTQTNPHPDPFIYHNWSFWTITVLDPPHQTYYTSVYTRRGYSTLQITQSTHTGICSLHTFSCCWKAEHLSGTACIRGLQVQKLYGRVENSGSEFDCKTLTQIFFRAK